MQNQEDIQNGMYISSSDASSSYGCSKDYISRLCREGRLKGTLLGRNWFIEADSFREFLSQKDSVKAEALQKLSEQRKKEYIEAQIKVTEEALRKRTEYVKSSSVLVTPMQVAYMLPAVQRKRYHGFFQNAVTAFLSICLVFLAYSSFSPVYFAQSLSEVKGLAQDAHGILTSGDFDIARVLSSVSQLASLFELGGGGLASVSNSFGNAGNVFSSLVSAVGNRFTATTSKAKDAVTSGLVGATVAPPKIKIVKVVETVREIEKPTYITNVINNTARQASVQTPSGVSQGYVDTEVQKLKNSLSSEIFKYSSTQYPNAPGISQATANLAISSRIDRLTRTTLESSIFNNGTITASTFSGGSISGSSVSASSLSVDGSASFAGGVSLTGGTLTLPYFNATSTSTPSYVAYRLGIATTSPYRELSVSGSGVFGGDILASTITATSSITTVDLSVSGNATTTGTGYFAGSIGIGTTTPYRNFSVQGNSYVSGLSFFGSAITATSTLSVSGLSTFAGLLSTASSTIGAGTQTTGLTIFGGATTTGNAYFAGGLGVGVATTTSGAIQTSGDVAVGGNLYVVGNSTTLGNSSSNTLTVNSSIISHLVPSQNITYDLGSASYYWRNVYVGNLNANNISAASTTISGTNSASFTVNADNISVDTEDADLIFFRGNVVPNALLSWKSALDRFELNQSVFIQNASTNNLAGVTLDLKGQAGQTGNLLRVASSTGTDYLNITSAGLVGIGSTTPSTNFTVQGNAYTSGSAFFGGAITATSTLNVTGLSTLGSLLVTGQITLGNASSTALSSNTAFFGQTGTTSISSTGALSTPALTITALTSGLHAASLNGATYSAATSSVSAGTGITFVGTPGALVGGTSLTIQGIAYPFALAGNATSTLTQFNGGLTSFASTTIGAGAQTTGLTIFGGATTTGDAYFAGNVGIGTTTPWGLLSVNANAIGTAPQFVVGSSTKTDFIVTNAGNIGIGTINPQTKLDIQGIASSTSIYVSDGSASVPSITFAGQNSAGFYRSGSGQIALSSGTQLMSNNGTVGAPSLSFINDGTSGIYRAGNPTQIGVVVGGTERLRIDTNGNFGVGTTTPSQTLSVQGNSYISGASFFGGAITATSTFTLTGIAAFNGGLTAFASTTIGAGAQTTGLTIFGGATTTGNAYFASRLGIATTSPGSALSVSGSADATVVNISASSNSNYGLVVQNAGGSGRGIQINAGSGTDNSALILSANNSAGTNYFTVTNGNSYFQNGNLGVGSTTPAATFGVVGSGMFSGDITALSKIIPQHISYPANTSNQTNITFTSAGSQYGTIQTESIGGTGAWSLGYQSTANTTLGTSVLTWNGSGRVGISTTSPSSALSVQGNSYISGTSFFGGAITATSTLNVTGLTTLVNASTTQISASGNAYFASTVSMGTTSSSAGVLTIATGSSSYDQIIDSTSARGAGLAFRQAGVDSGFVGIEGKWLGSSAANMALVGGSARGLNFYVNGGTTPSASIATTGLVGIGTTTPSRTLSVQGNSYVSGTSFFGGAITATSTLSVTGLTSLTQASTTEFSVFNQAYFGGTATSTFDSVGALSLGGILTVNNLTSDGKINFRRTGGDNISFEHDSNSIYLYNQTSGSVMANFRDSSFNGDVLFGYHASNSLGKLGVGTSSPWAKISASSTTATPTLGIEQLGSGPAAVFLGGNVGIGTTSPARRLSITDAVATAQMTVAYDSSRYTDFLTSSVGDLTITPQGQDIYSTDSNLWICTGGSCPSGTPTGTGNIIVENKIGIGTTTPAFLLSISSSNATDNLFQIATTTNQSVFVVNATGRVGVGTSTPTQQFSIADRLFVGAGGASGMGTATSTFQGDIRITGKLDVGTIDPVYTIDGVKYATYGHSTIGVKEETVAVIEVANLNPKTGKYEKKISFRDLEEGTDLWLFYQVSDFGRDWKNLVINLTASFDGTVFYKKMPNEAAVIISASHAGEVSARFIADRFDSDKWPNIRPDQDNHYKGHELETTEGQGKAAGSTKPASSKEVSDQPFNSASF